MTYCAVRCGKSYVSISNNALMVNYEMKFTVADATRIFKVENKVVKDLLYFFSEYLSSKANPPKGIKIIFKLKDMRIMAFALLYWEEEPDIEYIKVGLNLNDHYEDESINNLISDLTPMFFDPPKNIDETWEHGVLFCGLAEFGDTFYLANSYKHAGDKLAESALSDQGSWELFCPIVYNYRHATELYLKAVTGHYEARHNLLTLYSRFEKLVQKEFNENIPEWFKNIVIVFNDFDPGGTTFRYGGTINNDEVFVDLRQLKTLMGRMAHIFQKVRMHQGMPDALL
jgi:hypothetical protein